jgi:hypothetical protein
MKYELVHKVHQTTNLSECEERATTPQHVHRLLGTIKKSMAKTHRFTCYVTFTSIYSYRDFVNKCTYVNRNCICKKNRLGSDAIMPADVLVLLAIMTFLFFYVLHLALGCVA